MAGTIRGRTNFRVQWATGPDFTEELSRNCFYNVAKFFDDHPGYARIASYYGISGSGLVDEGPSGPCRWGVWRKLVGHDVLDVFIACSAGANDSTINPSGSYSFQGNLGVGLGIMVGYHENGAWNGTTNNNGNDSFVAPHQWRSGSVIWPDQNMIYGFNESTKSTLQSALETGFANNDTYGFIVGDDDSFGIYFNVSNTNVTNSYYPGYIAFERYVPASASFDLPYFMQSADGNDSSGYYQQISLNILGANNVRNAISVAKPRANKPTTFMTGCYPAAIYYNNYLLENSWPLNPTPQYESPMIDYFISGGNSYIPEYPILLGAAVFGSQYVGYTDFTRIVHKTNTYKAKTAFSNQERVTFGTLENNVIPSCSVRWSSNFSLNSYDPVTSSVYGLFLTGTLFTQAPQQSFLYESLESFVYITQSFNPLYRYRAGGNYFYTKTPTFTETDLTLIRSEA